MSKRIRYYCALIGAPIVFATCTAISSAQVNVTTYHNDNARTGQNTAETVLTTANVNSNTFGKLFSVAVDAQIYAQPLVLSDVTIAGGKHNVVYVATENNSLYAIDASNGTIYWQTSLMNLGATPLHLTDLCSQTDNITPIIGVTGTPVIDTLTNTIYVVTSTEESNGAYNQRLHALDVVTHAEKFGGPVVIAASYRGSNFSAIHQLNRPGLLLLNGHVVLAFGQHCNNEGYGWVMSYNTSTLALEAAYNTDPLAIHGSVWMGGDGVAVDSSGNLFFSTGDGLFDGVTDFADSIVKLGPPSAGAFAFLDSFTPHNYANLYAQDWDLGSGGVLVLPDLPSGAHPHLLVQAGKEGTIYLIDRANMGKNCGTPTCADCVVQELTSALTGGDARNLVGVWGSPAYWNGNVYFGSATKDNGNVADYMKAYSFNAGGSGLLSATPTSRTPTQFVWPAPSPSVSSNGTTNGIVWAIDNSSYKSACCAVLHAYNANNLGSELYNTNQAGQRDTLGGAVKFTTPTIANGKVYVGGNVTLSVYGTNPPLFCTPTYTCKAHLGKTGETAAITLSCSQVSSISVSASACNIGIGCKQSSNQGNVATISTQASQDYLPGTAQVCGFQWSWGGNQYSASLPPQ